MRRWMNLVEKADFQAWFGNSKCIDRTGKPLVVYHGSPDVRDILSQGFRTSMHRGDVYFFSDDYHVANTYADDRRAFDYQNAEPHTLGCYLSIQNPMVINAGGRAWKDTEEHVDAAKAAGHDGIIIQNSRDEYNAMRGTGRPSAVYVVFSPEQIRSAKAGPLSSRITGDPLDGEWVNRL